MLKINKCKQATSIFALASMLSISALFNNYITVSAKDVANKELVKENESTSNFSKETREIIEEISNSTKNSIILNDLDLCLESDEYSEYFLAQAICTFGHEQRKVKYSDAYSKDQYNPYLYTNYNIDDISIINNYNGGMKGLKNQIYMLTKLADFGNFSLYEVHDEAYSYIITNRDGKVLNVSDGHDFIELGNQDIELTSFKDFLNDYGMSSKVRKNYSYIDLFEDLTYQISEQISLFAPSDKVRTSDVLVLDATISLTISENKDRDYYFIKYAYPYLFIQGRDVYVDPSNLNAKVTVDEINTLRYYDAKNQISLFDLDMHFVDGGKSSSSLVKFSDFMKNNNCSVGLYVTDEYLRELSNLFNESTLDKKEVKSITK